VSHLACAARLYPRRRVRILRCAFWLHSPRIVMNSFKVRVRSLLRPVRTSFFLGCLAKVGLLACVAGCEPRGTAAEPAASPESVATSVQALTPGEPKPTAPAPAKQAAIQKDVYGDLNGQSVERYTLTNSKGLHLGIITYGAIITDFYVPDRAGKLDDIVLGFDKLDQYVKGSPYFGAIVGRVGNRIANARFELDGKKYKLAANNAPHHLHGGAKGWDKVVWNAEPIDGPKGPALKLTYVSKDGEEGYPGTVNASAIYTLTNDNELRVEMSATTDKTTLVNMVHHSYWNLAGHKSGTIKNQELQLFASRYTPPDGLVPTGKVAPVAATPFDFTSAKLIGKDLMAAGGTPVGFDHNWVVDGDAHTLRRAAKLRDPASGRSMTIEADQPGIQFYTGNFLDGKALGKGETPYPQYSGLCLETQTFPNSVNVPAWRKEVILEPGQTYSHTMIHRFSIE
jgi:aldose 1-epimerase